MIVKCADGKFHKNPVWRNDRTVVTADLEVELFFKFHRPVSLKTLKTGLGTVGLSRMIDLDIKSGNMIEMIFGDSQHKAFNVTGKWRGRGKLPPVPTQSVAVFDIEPTFLEDEVIDRSRKHG